MNGKWQQTKTKCICNRDVTHATFNKRMNDTTRAATRHVTKQYGLYKQ